jgi:glycerol-3-phosphate O-acyltransferase/dihydroxyacetone phosphate acyltransferase
MNYFHAHKFRSRAVVEFGSPVEIPNELVEMYKNGQKREAVGQVLETVYQALVSVTVTSPDYDTLMVCLNLNVRQLTHMLTLSSSFKQ